MDKKELLISFAVSFVAAFLAIGLYMFLLGTPKAPAPQPMTPQMGVPMMPRQPMPGQSPMQGQPPMQGQMQPPMPQGQHPMPQRAGQMPMPHPGMVQGRPPMPVQAGQPNTGAKPMPMPTPVKK